MKFLFYSTLDFIYSHKWKNPILPSFHSQFFLQISVENYKLLISFKLFNISTAVSIFLANIVSSARLQLIILAIILASLAFAGIEPNVYINRLYNFECDVWIGWIGWICATNR